MGMYTEVYFAAEVDAEAYEVLSRIKGGTDPEAFSNLHPFFKDDRAAVVFGHGGSYYFPGACHFTLEMDTFGAPLYSASLRANLKNYDGTIQAFFDWIRPHVKCGAGENDLIGFWMYEEAEAPTLVYKDAG